MRRLLLSLAVVVAMFGSAAAEKTKLAVLGLEVAGSPDTSSTSHGRLLTDELRKRADRSQKFMLAPNSAKDLLDEKLSNTCETEAIDCMAKIGVRMKVSLLIYGKLEKRPSGGREGYQVSIRALEVDTKKTRDWGDWIPLSEFADGHLDARVSRGYDALTGESTPLPPNNGGNVANNGGGSVIAKPTPKKSTGTGWKITAYTATAVTIGLAAGGFYFRGKVNELNGNCHPAMMGALDDPTTYTQGPGEPSASDCAKGSGYQNKARLTGGAAIAVGGFALFAYYQGFLAKKGESNQQTGSRVRKKKNLAVTPVVSPDGAGATVRIDW